MYESMFEQAKGTTNERSGLFNQLDEVRQADVTEYLEWLPSQGLQKNTINSYKTYICKAMLKDTGDLEGELTSDEKSAVKKFAAFIAARPAAEPSEED